MLEWFESQLSIRIGIPLQNKTLYIWKPTFSILMICFRDEDIQTRLAIWCLLKLNQEADVFYDEREFLSIYS